MIEQVIYLIQMGPNDEMLTVLGENTQQAVFWCVISTGNTQKTSCSSWLPKVYWVSIYHYFYATVAANQAFIYSATHSPSGLAWCRSFISSMDVSDLPAAVAGDDDILRPRLGTGSSLLDPCGVNEPPPTLRWGRGITVPSVLLILLSVPLVLLLLWSAPPPLLPPLTPRTVFGVLRTDAGAGGEWGFEDTDELLCDLLTVDEVFDLSGDTGITGTLYS